MSDVDREMREKLQKLESLEARLSQHEKTTRVGLIWLTILAFAVLFLFGYYIIRL